MRLALACLVAVGAAVGICSCFQSLDGFSGGTPDAAGGEGESGVLDAIALDATSSVDAGEDAPSAPHCRVGNPDAGASMVRVVDAEYCIDTTEVTNDQYLAFLLAQHPMPANCGWKTTYHSTPYAGKGAVGNVDWCDAYAFCQWAGKRLCGGRKGVELDLQNSHTALSEWQYACTRGGNPQYPFPYGTEVNPTICLYGDDAPARSRDVASNERCVGPEAVFDMSGNVWEWEDACDRSHGDAPDYDCNLRGGGFLRPSSNWGACALVPSGWTRKSFTDDTGIRCCADFQ